MVLDNERDVDTVKRRPGVQAGQQRLAKELCLKGIKPEARASAKRLF